MHDSCAGFIIFLQSVKNVHVREKFARMFCNSRVVIEKITDFVLSGIFFCSSHLTGYFFI